MALFNQKKTPVPPEKLQAAQEEKSQITAEMKNLDRAAAVLDTLEKTLAGMCTPGFRTKVLNAAKENQQKMERFDKLYDRKISECTKDCKILEAETIGREKAVIKGAEIQYQNTRLEDVYQESENRLCFTEEEVRAYQEIPQIMRGVLEDCQPSDVSFCQAEEILPELNSFLEQLETALESGQKLKADVCKIVFSYIIQVVLKKKPSGSEEKIKKILTHRRQVMTGQFTGIMETVDEIYYLVNDLKSYQIRQEQLQEKYQELRKKKDELPQEFLDELYKIGFKNMREKYPDDEMVYYAENLFIGMRNITVWLKIVEIGLRNCCDLLAELEHWLSQMLCEVMRNFNTDTLENPMDILEDKPFIWNLCRIDSLKEKNKSELQQAAERIKHEISSQYSFQELDELMHSNISDLPDKSDI